jgi:hypothetical protein
MATRDLAELRLKRRREVAGKLKVYGIQPSFDAVGLFRYYLSYPFWLLPQRRFWRNPRLSPKRATPLQFRVAHFSPSRMHSRW